MECRVMADENAFQYRIERLELQWEHYEASGQFTADLCEQIEKLMRDPEWFWEGVGFDGLIGTHLRPSAVRCRKN